MLVKVAVNATFLCEIVWEQVEALQVAEQKIEWLILDVVVMINFLKSEYCITLSIKDIIHLLALELKTPFFKEPIESQVHVNMKHDKASDEVGR